MDILEKKTGIILKQKKEEIWEQPKKSSHFTIFFHLIIWERNLFLENVLVEYLSLIKMTLFLRLVLKSKKLLPFHIYSDMDSFAKNDPNEQSKKSIKRSEVIKQLSELPNKMFHTFFYGIINKKICQCQKFKIIWNFAYIMMLLHTMLLLFAWKWIKYDTNIYIYIL